VNGFTGCDVALQPAFTGFARPDVATPALASGRADSRGCEEACQKAAWPRMVAAPILPSRGALDIRFPPVPHSSRRLVCV
jgi:hypothetical protein